MTILDGVTLFCCVADSLLSFISGNISAGIG